MKILTTNVIVFTLLFSGWVLAEREFTSSDGRTLLATIDKATEQDVTLTRTSDGKSFTIALDRLSKNDREFVQAWRTVKELNTRKARELTLSLGEGRTEVVNVPEGEILTADGVLTLVPGETVHIEFDEEGHPSITHKVKNPQRTVTFKMTNKDGITMLFRETRVQKTVAMDCENRGLGSPDFSRTNLHPTEKGLMAGDSWPGSVWTLRLSNFEVTDRSAQEVYSERVAR
ncbi:hypothetical protein [Haloferula sp.]|uniref:hypothetical protein n=1 Tax=Haloferula sp. TaxID=2497595 RepID=UPI003C72A198